MKHPLQRIITTEHDSLPRFQANPIVKFLLDAGPFDMNQLLAMPFENPDREQFAQLIGLSVAGFCELPYVSEEAMDRAGEMLDTMKDGEDQS